MPISKKLLNALQKRKVAHKVIPHKTVFTAYDLATTLGEDLDRVAKTILVRAGNDLAFASVPASARVDFDKLAAALGAKSVRIASEDAVGNLGIVGGTTPPFASVYGVRCVLDRGLAKCKRMICRAGSLTESLDCSMRDFIAMEQPIIAPIAMRSDAGKPKKKVKGAGGKQKKATKRAVHAKSAKKRKPANRKARR